MLFVMDEAAGLPNDFLVKMATYMQEYHPMCAGMIDQGIFIGSDPIGHACYNKATTQYRHPEINGVFWPVCTECLHGLFGLDERKVPPRMSVQVSPYAARQG